MFSGRSVTSWPPFVVKEYISLWTMSEEAPTLLTKTDKQKQIFIEEMVRLSHERGLD